ncbi:uncharacterized protein LOC134846151 [Symsagittifera roscoffensis]|uniref:uncharacterized protein LOC134846151 n=1 Tax=Symsagittifera roscoffensis TaxID=84072 RepID=UPI00307BC8F7
MSLTVLMGWFSGLGFCFLCIFCCLFGRSSNKPKQDPNLIGQKKDSGNTCLGVWVCDDHGAGQVPHPLIVSRWYQQLSVVDTVEIYVKLQNLLQSELAKGMLLYRSDETNGSKLLQNEETSDSPEAARKFSTLSSKDTPFSFAPFGVNESVGESQRRYSRCSTGSIKSEKCISWGATTRSQSNINAAGSQQSIDESQLFFQNKFCIKEKLQLHQECPIETMKKSSFAGNDDRVYCFKENCPLGGVTERRDTLSSSHSYKEPDSLIGCLPLTRSWSSERAPNKNCMKFNSRVVADNFYQEHCTEV